MNVEGLIPDRVLMTADTVGGVWSYAIELSRGLSSCGIEVILATMGAAVRPEQQSEADAIDGLTLCESPYALEWMEEPWEDVRKAGEWLLELEQRYSPDVIHLNGYVHASLPWKAPTMVVAHSCVLSWFRAVKGVDAPTSWRRYASAVRAGILAADLVVAPSAGMLHALKDHYGSIARTRIIPNGYDPKVRAPVIKEPLVLSVGRHWDEAKNVRSLAAIAPDLAWPVRLIGDATDPQGRMSDLPNVEHLGRLDRDQVGEHLARASIYALPARYEPFGLSILEAAFSRCALVLGDLPSLRENWEKAAIFVAPDDTDGLRKEITALIDDPQRRRDLGEKALARAQYFSRQRMLTHYLDAYANLRASCDTAALV